MKIKCPHCGATNQDVSENDPCWQCGTVLKAPPSALNTGEGPPTSAANPAISTPDTSEPPPPMSIASASPAARAPKPTPAPPKAPQTVERPAPVANTTPARQATNWVVVGVVIALILAVIIIAVMVLRPH